MFTIVDLVKKKAPMSRNGFAAFWIEDHTQLAASSATSPPGPLEKPLPTPA